MNYKLVNNLIGWAMFLVALVVYTITLEPSVSLWDCGEFISASDKLQVVHPPGAPFFLLIGRIFSLFASSPEGVAHAVNMQSAICSALTVLFTFWITTHFAKKMVSKMGDATTGSSIAIFASGVIAALALTFSDSFWFSAVEAEVYAMSSFFTAFTFWVMLRWEESNSPFADKWIILIAYLIGLAIGTHLLNLLVIPAVAFIYYFKKYDYTRKGLLYCFLIGLAILFFVQKGIIPGVPSLMAKFDLLFVNSFGFGFGSGSMFALILIVGITVTGIYYFTKIKVRPHYNLAFLCLAYILLGYSSYTMVVIRSLDNPAIDMNNPEEPFNLLSYINREQYGSRPLAYGPYFNAPPVDVIEGDSIYRKDEKSYTGIGIKREYEYDKSYCTFFPRMGDNQEEYRSAGYRYWSGMEDVQNEISSSEQQYREAKDPKQKEQLGQQIQDLKAQKPTFGNNLTFMFRYQLWYMYGRYFMWNFVGRQNDKQGRVETAKVDGNWISGIAFIDQLMLGPQKNMPEYMANNQAKNKFFFLPLILGVLGLIFHFKRGKSDAIVTTVLFVFTGILIIIFLNQPPFEPRERDYSHVGSFQTFCIWIGLGVLFIWDKLRTKLTATNAAVLAGIMSLSAPVLMGTQGWDDHDRSKRYLGIDFAKNYLQSCPPNAILFTNGDNDTYPLWYAQNVEQIRTDVRIINQSLLPTDWYSQILLTKVYKSEPLPLSLTKNQLAAGVNDYFEFNTAQKSDAPVLLSRLIKDLTTSPTPNFNTRTFVVPVNKAAVLSSGVVSLKDSAIIVRDIVFNFPSRSLNKGDLVLLDLVATNAATGWKRPICFTTTSGSDGFLNMESYFERRGLVYQLIPIKSEARGGESDRVNEDVVYDNLMNKYKFSGMKDKPHFFLDDKAEIVPSVLRQLFVSLALNYANKINEIKQTDSSISLDANKVKVKEYKNKAYNLLQKCNEEIPERVLHNSNDVNFTTAQLYHEIGKDKEAEAALRALFESCKQEIGYFIQYNGNKHASNYMKSIVNDSYQTLQRASEIGAKAWGYTKLQADMDKSLKGYEQSVKTFLSEPE